MSAPCVLRVTGQLSRSYPIVFEAAVTGFADTIVQQLLDSDLFCTRHNCDCSNMVFGSDDDVAGFRDNPHPIMAICQVELRKMLELEGSLNAVWNEVMDRIGAISGESPSKQQRRLRRRLEQLKCFVGFTYASRQQLAA